MTPDSAAFVASADQLLSIACRSAHVGIWQWDIATGQMDYSSIAKDILGVPMDANVTIARVRAATHADDLANNETMARRALDPAIRDKATYIYRILREDTGEQRWVQVCGEAQFAVVDGVERAVLYVGTVQDITAIKHHEERLATVARELKHRLLNAYSVMGIIAKRSWAGTADPATALTEFQHRLGAMGRVTELLFASDGEMATLTELIQALLSPYLFAGDDRFVVNGPEVVLTRKVADILAMALHELATNAVKYGAVGAAKGRVDITWVHRPDGILTLTWQESGGPPVVAPTRQGFGTQLLLNALTTPPDLVTLQFDPAGVHCTLRLTLA